MTLPSETLWKVLRGTSDANVAFSDLMALLHHLGFSMRTKGSHHIFTKEGIPESLNLQPKWSAAKPYQVRQVRGVILKYRLARDP